MILSGYDKATNFIIAAVMALSFFIYNFLLISNGHFHEDAYILFVYVENVLNGNGITFYPSGPPTEGATDFLWMVFLIILGKLGINVGTSVILLNSIGVFIICFLLSREISKVKTENNVLLYLLYPFTIFWIFQQPLIAAAGGFSVFLYMALVLLAFVSVYHERYFLYTPYISLIIALFRPDGVIIGAGFTLIGLYLAYRNDKLRLYLYGVFFGVLTGAAYFIWRYDYFGNLLPLPLYVKGHGSLMAGFDANLFWLKRNLHILLPLLFLSVLNRQFWRMTLMSTPVILLFLALGMAHQSQNIGYRFQAPLFIVFYFGLIIQIVHYFSNNALALFAKRLLQLYVFALMLVGLKYLWETRHLVKFNYINQIPLVISSNLPEHSTIALTEAGRLAYWNQAGKHKIIDLVGLNSVYPAKNTISYQYLEQLAPDMIMYDHAGQINQLLFEKNASNIILMTDDKRNIFTNRKAYTDSERALLPKVTNASIVTTQFLQNHFDAYDIYLVDYKGNKRFSHIYAFKKELKLRNRMHDLLNAGFQKERALSYYEMLAIRNNKIRDTDE